MKFIREDRDQAVATIAETIIQGLYDNGGLVWLVSGGSNIEPQCAVMAAVKRECSDEQIARMMIVAVDERYGSPGHDDSNYAQLHRAGFDPGTASWVDVLAAGTTFDETVQAYDKLMRQILDAATTVVATLGLGADAHTAGILPESPATQDTDQMVLGYEWKDYRRMTSTRRVLLRTTTTYVLAYGESKHDALRRLNDNNETFVQLPSRVLYELPSVYVYNDLISEGGI
ncbi:MAG: 6-phosphogluconolactonase [Candidatus Saccharimonadales bacterium]